MFFENENPRCDTHYVQFKDEKLIELGFFFLESNSNVKGWLHGEFQPGWPGSPGSVRNPLEMKVTTAWRRFQLGMKILARFLKPSWDWANELKIPQKVHVIEMECQPRLKRQREHAQWGCFLGNTILARVNCNNISAHPTGLKFQPGLIIQRGLIFAM